MTDIVDRLRTVDISWSQEGEWCAEAADEIIQLREHKNKSHELMVWFVEENKRLRHTLDAVRFQAAKEIKQLREALKLERQLKDDALRAFNESQAALKEGE